MADSTQEILHRRLAEEYKTMPPLKEKNTTLFLLRAKPLNMQISGMLQSGETIGREGRAFANLVTKKITDLNHTKSVKQE